MKSHLCWAHILVWSYAKTLPLALIFPNFHQVISCNSLSLSPKHAKQYALQLRIHLVKEKYDIFPQTSEIHNTATQPFSNIQHVHIQWLSYSNITNTSKLYINGASIPINQRYSNLMRSYLFKNTLGALSPKILWQGRWLLHWAKSNRKCFQLLCAYKNGKKS